MKIVLLCLLQSNIAFYVARAESLVQKMGRKNQSWLENTNR